MSFFRREDWKRQENLWLIEREHTGEYFNSPAVWRQVGFIRANSPAAALTKAEQVVGNNNVRVKNVGTPY